MTHPFYKKQRLPRRLKKASRHVDFEVCDMQPMADVSADEKNVIMRLDVDYRVVMRPADYPRTRQVQPSSAASWGKRTVGRLPTYCAVSIWNSTPVC